MLSVLEIRPETSNSPLRSARCTFAVRTYEAPEFCPVKVAMTGEARATKIAARARQRAIHLHRDAEKNLGRRSGITSSNVVPPSLLRRCVNVRGSVPGIFRKRPACAGTITQDAPMNRIAEDKAAKGADGRALACVPWLERLWLYLPRPSGATFPPGGRASWRAAQDGLSRSFALPNELVPTLRVGMPSGTLCVPDRLARADDAERRGRHSHGERGNEGRRLCIAFSEESPKKKGEARCFSPPESAMVDEIDASGARGPSG